MLRTSIVPTIIKGGFRENVIPSDAEGLSDVRALPELKPRTALDRHSQRNNQRSGSRDPSRSDKARSGRRRRLPPSRTKCSARSNMPHGEYSQGGHTCPNLKQTGVTGSELRAKGVQAYGIGVPHTDDDARRVHCDDERVPIECSSTSLSVTSLETPEILELAKHRSNGRNPHTIDRGAPPRR